MTTDLLNGFVNHNICTYTIPPMHNGINNPGNVPNGNGSYFKFSINTIPNVEFISIWNIGFNNFPANNDMDWIFNNIV